MKQATELKEIFGKNKLRGEGEITKDDLKYRLSQLADPLTNAVIDDMLNIAIVNDEGKIDFKKFVLSETKEERITDKADIWAAACVLYHLLSGKDAFNSR